MIIIRPDSFYKVKKETFESVLFALLTLKGVGLSVEDCSYNIVNDFLRSFSEFQKKNKNIRKLNNYSDKDLGLVKCIIILDMINTMLSVGITLDSITFDNAVNMNKFKFETKQ